MRKDRTVADNMPNPIEALLAQARQRIAQEINVKADG